ncbi:MAG TPA: hypothetical protein VFX28_12090, partial [Methylomirabilota bacterium]|nr:hypothetical protein [Methylomirabilota bacterium]
PYLSLPFYWLEAVDRQGSSYHLVHINELSASVFVLMPALLLGCVPLLRAEGDWPGRRVPRLLLALLAAQLAPLVLTVAAAARYYLDFLPLLVLLAALGARQLGPRLGRGGLVALWTLSLLLSFALVPNGLRVYESYVGYRPAVLQLWPSLSPR